MVKKSLILLNKIKHLSYSEMKVIVEYFKDTDGILKASKSDLLQAGLRPKSVDSIVALNGTGDLDEELARIDKEGITVVDIFDKDYPFLLKEIAHPPVVLYIKGDKELFKELCFAIVGSRLATFYGIAMAEKFSFALSSLGLVIVSGLAKGIDTAAHKAALEGGRTIAVLGSGLLNIYPAQNKYLASKIAQNGALVSEFPLTEPPLRENFPRRNRIISGLAKGVLVVEAAARSGALITARYALEQNREVFALPGKADSPVSKGTHDLIKQGAKLVDSLDDILGELNICWQKQEKKINLTSQEKKIFSIIDREGIFLEEIILKTGLNTSEVNKIVLNLQIRGLIKEDRPLYFARKTYG